jgi:hypothetical protein
MEPAWEILIQNLALPEVTPPAAMLFVILCGNAKIFRAISHEEIFKIVKLTSLSSMKYKLEKSSGI